MGQFHFGEVGQFYIGDNSSEADHPTDNQKYTYDAQNRLTEVQDQSGHLIASYQYDPLGRRLRKTIHRAWDGAAWTPLPEKETHTYVYADEGLAAEYKTSGSGTPQLTAEYGWQPEGLWGTDPVWIKTTKQGDTQAEFYYDQNDHLGTPQQILDAQGTPVWRMKATAFGEIQVDPNSTIANPLRFPGQYYDQETSTHYNGVRSYVPSNGRYLTADPLALNWHLNLYSYAHFSPLGYYDPDGKAATLAWCFGGPAACAVGVTAAVGSLIWAQSHMPKGNGGVSPSDSSLPLRDKSGAKVSPAAQCMTAPGNCSPNEQKELQDEVNDACSTYWRGFAALVRSFLVIAGVG